MTTALVPLAEALRGPYAHIVGIDPVNPVMVRHLLEAMDWDHDRGGDWVPLSTYLTFAMPAYRELGSSLPSQFYPPLPYQDVDLPGEGRLAIALGVTAGVPMRWGDRIASAWSVAGYKPIRTRLGDGTLVDFEARFTNGRGQVVATETTSMLCYQRASGVTALTASNSPGPPLNSGGSAFDSNRPAVGQRLADAGLELSTQRLAMIAAANRDFAPTHVDVAAAAAIGAPAPIANSMFALAVIERALLQSSGPAAALRELGPFRLIRPIPAGVRVQVEGWVAGLTQQPAATLVRFAIQLRTVPGGVAAVGDAVLKLPPVKTEEKPPTKTGD